MAVGTPEPRRLGFDRRTYTLIDADNGRLRHYTVRAQTNPSEATLRALAGPTPGFGGVSPVRQFQSDPRVRRLARGLLATAGLGDGPPDDEQERWAWNRAAANVLLAFLQSGRFGYETDLRDVRNGDRCIRCCLASPGQARRLSRRRDRRSLDRRLGPLRRLGAEEGGVAVMEIESEKIVVRNKSVLAKWLAVSPDGSHSTPT